MLFDLFPYRFRYSHSPSSSTHILIHSSSRKQPHSARSTYTSTFPSVQNTYPHMHIVRHIHSFPSTFIHGTKDTCATLPIKDTFLSHRPYSDTTIHKNTHLPSRPSKDTQPFTQKHIYPPVQSKHKPFTQRHIYSPVHPKTHNHSPKDTFTFPSIQRHTTIHPKTHILSRPFRDTQPFIQLSAKYAFTLPSNQNTQPFIQRQIYPPIHSKL